MPKSLGVDAIRASIKGVTRALSDRNIRVTQVGTKAFVESKNGIPQRVNIPNIPDDASNQIVSAVNGFLDHEVAHLLYTDFDASSGANMSESEFGIYNALEDTRIEREMCKRFLGSRKNLESVASFMIEKSVEPQYVGSDDPSEKMSILFMPSIRAWSGQEMFEDFMADKWVDMEAIESKIKALIPRIKSLSSTKDAVGLAIEIHAALKDDEDESEDDQEGDEDGDNKPNDDSDDDSDGDDSDGDDSDGDDSDGDDSDGDDSDGDDSDGDDESSGEGGFDEPGGNTPNGESSTPKGKESKKDKVDLISDVIEKIKDFDDEVSDEISKMSLKEISNSDYIVYTKDNDVIEPFKIGRDYSSRHLESLEDEVRHITGPLQKTLERLVIAKSHCRNLPGKTSGRVNPSSLYRLKTGDRRVFRHREEADSKDVAVSLLIDCSGSMYGAGSGGSSSKIKIAMQCAFALSSVLSRLNVTNEVIGFTTIKDRRATNEAEEEGDKLGIDFSRIEPLYMPIFKSFDERLGTEQKKRMAYGAVESRYLRNNIDGECVAIAAKRLANRSESGKKMFVLSDGNPAGMGNRHAINTNLKDTVEDIEKSNIDIMGIGIADASVARYYKKCVVINDVASLPKILMAELKMLLV